MALAALAQLACPSKKSFFITDFALAVWHTHKKQNPFE